MPCLRRAGVWEAAGRLLAPWVLTSVVGSVVPPIPACPGCFSPLLGKSLEVLAGACSRAACALRHSRDLAESTKDDSQRLRSRICSPGMLPPSDAQLQSAVHASELQIGFSASSKSPQTGINRKESAAGRGLGAACPCSPCPQPKGIAAAWRGAGRASSKGLGQVPACS